MQKIQLLEPTYGSDQHGLIWGYRFEHDQPAQPITAEEAIHYLDNLDNLDNLNELNHLNELRQERPEQFIWLHFSLSNSASEAWLYKHLDLPAAFYESLHSNVGTTRLEQDDDALVAVLQDILFDFEFDSDFKFDAAAVATTHLCVKRYLLISARFRPLRSIDQLRKAVRGGQIFHSTAELLACLLLMQSEVLVGILRQSTQRADYIEDTLLAQRRSISRSELGALRRILVRLQRLLAPEPAAFFRLLNRPPAWITPKDLQDLQQAAEEFSATVSDTTGLIERVKLLQEELIALSTEATSRTLFILTMVTVLALPVNMVAGLFGMNVGGIPLADQEHGFSLIAGGLLILTIILVYLTFLKHRD